MLTLIRVLIVVFVSFCLMLKAHAEGEATLSGVVKDAAGQPLQGAEIRIQGNDASKVGKIHTNANGHYSYPALETGTYSVTLLVDGATKASISNVRTKAGETQTLNFELRNGAAARPFTKGKHYVWVPSQTGSHLGQWMEVEDDGRTMPSGMAERLNNQGNALVRQLQAKGADMPSVH
jgi:VCBS repeat-containing protein